MKQRPASRRCRRPVGGGVEVNPALTLEVEENVAREEGSRKTFAISAGRNYRSLVENTRASAKGQEAQDIQKGDEVEKYVTNARQTDFATRRSPRVKSAVRRQDSLPLNTDFTMRKCESGKQSETASTF